MNAEVFRGLMIPFVGTSLGSACALFMRGKLNALLQRALTGFAAGVMVAASIWSLLMPAMDQVSLFDSDASKPIAERLRPQKIGHLRLALSPPGAILEQDRLVGLVAGIEQLVGRRVPAERRQLHGEQIAELPRRVRRRGPFERRARLACHK